MIKNDGLMGLGNGDFYAPERLRNQVSQTNSSKQKKPTELSSSAARDRQSQLT